MDFLKASLRKYRVVIALVIAIFIPFYAYSMLFMISPTQVFRNLEIKIIPAKKINLTESTKITLERGPCYGSCPVYKMVIDSNGYVTMDMDAYQDGKIINKHFEKRISKDKVDALVSAFNHYKFRLFEDAYLDRGLTDLPTDTITYSSKDFTKRVKANHGDLGMPSEFKKLADEIDRIVGTDNWLNQRGISE